MQYVNLLPSDVRERERNRVRMMAWSVASAVMLAALMAGYLVLRQKTAIVVTRVAGLRERRSELDTRIARLQDLSGEREKLQCRELIIKTLLDRRGLCHLFAELAESTPDLVWLESSRVSQPQAEAPPAPADESEDAEPAPVVPAAPPRRQVVLTGFATTNTELARFMSALHRSSHIQEPVLSFSKGDRFLDGEATKFEVRFEF